MLAALITCLVIMLVTGLGAPESDVQSGPVAVVSEVAHMLPMATAGAATYSLMRATSGCAMLLA